MRLFDCKVRIEGNLAGRWSRAVLVMLSGIEDSVLQAGREGVAEARARHPYKDRTGRLTQETMIEREKHMRLGTEIVIVAKPDYASFVEYGTKRHPIAPSIYGTPKGVIVRVGQSAGTVRNNVPHGVGRGQWLRWKDAGGAVIFARRVDHPGSRPYPFMALALKKAEEVLLRELPKVIARAQKELL